MREILLSQGKIALVDDDDFELISSHKWHAKMDRNTFYAKTHIRIAGRFATLHMHRLILGVSVGLMVDHLNNNGLDNRRCNLRLANGSQNQWNSRKRQALKGTAVSSQYKGVNYKKAGKRWAAQIGMYGRRKHLGYFASEELAAQAYDEAAKKYFGEFARLNFS